MIDEEMDVRLADVFKALAETFPKDDFLAEELLDIVWLTPRVGPRASAGGVAPPLLSVVAPEEPRREGRAPATSGASTAEESLQPPTTAQLPPPLHVNIHTDAERELTAGRTIPASPLPTPQAPVISGSRAIARALRPLTKQIAAMSEWIFDETATVERYAEQKVFETVMVPSPSRWLRVELIVERTPSMRIWRESIEDLRRVLERHSAFRSIRSWNLLDREGTLEIGTWSREPRVVQWGELTDPTAPQLVIVASDCVSTAWSDGRMGELLGTWTGRGPVAVVQVLPPELWHQTGLGHATRTMLRATAPGAPNSTLTEIAPPWEAWDPARTVKVPVAMLDPAELTRWASLVAATGGATAPGYVLPRRAKGDEPTLEAIPESRTRSARERVGTFDAVGTRAARRLARYFAAAPFPLTPPVMRLIQSTMLPGTPNSAIAEIVVGGIMHVAETRGDIESELIRYDFRDDVRERLFDGANWSDLLRVVQMNASQYIDECFDRGADFGALLAGRGVTGDRKIPAAEEPFARVGLAVLDRLGGEYRDLANQLRSHKPPAGEPLREWSEPTHPRRPRVELAAYLGDGDAVRLVGPDKTAPRHFGDWMRGLHRWGLPVMLEGMLAAADEVTKSIEDEVVSERREALVEAARACLRVRTGASVAVLRELFSGAPRDRDDVTLAGEAVAAAIGSEYPALEQTEIRVAEVAKIASAAVPALELRAAVRKRLMTDLLREESLVPDLLPERPAIAVAGTREYRLPEIVQQTATVLGRALARSGHRLISGGRRGVDHLVARAFATELEMLGASPEARLVQLVPPRTIPDFNRGVVVPVEEGVWNDECAARSQAVMTIAGSDHVESFLSVAEWRHRACFPLRWTGGTSKTVAERGGVLPRYGRPAMLDEGAPQSLDDVRLMVARLIAWTMIGTDRTARDAWSRYSDLLRTLLNGELATTAVEFSAPRLHALLQSLKTESPATLAIFSHDIYAELDSLAPGVTEWLLYDLLALAEVEPHALRDRDLILERLGVIAGKHAPGPARAWLTRRLRDLEGPVPGRQLDGIMAVARGVFGRAQALDRWTRETLGLGEAEASFRASIPIEAFRAADAHLRASIAAEADQQIAMALRSLVSASPSREAALALMRADAAVLRVIGYLLLQLEKVRLGAGQLAEVVAAEGSTAAKESETKPLRQLLLALLQSWEALDAEGKRLLARALAAGHAALEGRPSADPRKYCRNYIRSGLKTVFRESAAENAAIDREAARYWKRLRGKIISARMKLPPMAKVDIGAEEITFLLRHGNHAQRVFAVSFAVTTKRPEAADAVIALIAGAATRGELHVGCAVAAWIGERLTAPQRRRLVEALTARRDALRGGRLAGDLARTIAQLTEN